MLWDVVFDFYIKYIFGGIIYENGVFVGYAGKIGGLWLSSESIYSDYRTDTLLINMPDLQNRWYMQGLYMPLGNYLSLIATIISMVVIVVLACLFIKKIYNMVAHVIA